MKCRVTVKKYFTRLRNYGAFTIPNLIQIDVICTKDLQMFFIHTHFKLTEAFFGNKTDFECENDTSTSTVVHTQLGLKNIGALKYCIPS